MIISTPARTQSASRRVMTATAARHGWLAMFPQNERLANSLALKGLYTVTDLTLLHRYDVLCVNVISPRHTRWINGALDAHKLEFLPDEQSVTRALRTYYGGVGAIPLRLLPYAVPGIGERSATILRAFREYGVLSLTDMARSSEADFIRFADKQDPNPWAFNAPKVDPLDKEAILRLMRAFRIRFQ